MCNQRALDRVTPARNVETPSIERAKDGFVGFNTNTAQMFQNFLMNHLYHHQSLLQKELVNLLYLIS